MGQNTELLEPEDFFKKIADPNTVILDVRTPEEFNLGHIENAVLIDCRNEEFKNQLNKFDSAKTYLIYCRTGARSASTLEYLKDLKFKNLFDLNGGITHWLRKGFPIVGEKPDKILEKEYQEITSSSSVVLIDFFAPWCGPCTKMEPMFKKLSEKYNGKIKIVRINADENRKLSQSFKKRGFPILIAYKNQKIEWEETGFIEEQKLTGLIENLIK